MPISMTRKQFLSGATAAAAGAFAIHPARAARRSVIRFGLDLTTDHPTTGERHRRGEEDQGRDQRRGRGPGVPEQPARRRHAHAVQPAVGRDADDGDRRQHPGHAGAQRGDRQHRLRVQDARGGLEGARRQRRRPGARRHRQDRPARHEPDLGRRLPRDHLRHQADQDARRPARLQDPRPAEPDLAVACSSRWAPRRSRSTRPSSTPRCRRRSRTGRRTRSATSRP